MNDPRSLVLGIAFSVVVSFVALTGPALGEGKIPISGRVLGPSGQRLADARVDLMAFGYSDPREAVATGFTDSHGAFRLYAPTVGMWIVRVGADGFVARQTLLAPLVEAVELPAVELPRDAGLVVRVVDPTGQPAAGSWVLSTVGHTTGWGPVPWRVRSDGSGHLRQPWAIDDGLTLWAYRAGSVESVAAVPKRRESGEAQLELRLRAGRSRALLVTAPGRGYLPGIQVRVGVGSWLLGRTDETGSVNVLVPETGLLTVALEADDGRRGQAEMPFPTESFATEPFPKEPFPKEPAALELPSATILFGRVITHGARMPVPGAVVWHREDRSRFTRTDLEGRYRLVVQGGGKAVLAAAASGYRPDELELEPGALTRSAFGRVLNSEQQPIPGVEVTLSPEEERPPSACVPEKGPATTDNEGTFHLTAICAGTLRLTARAEGFAPMVLPGLAVPAADGPADPQGPWDLGTLILTRGNRLVGRVVDRDEVPVVGAEVTIRLEDKARKTLGSTGSVGAISDGEGRFNFTGLPVAGGVDLTVRASGYALKEVLGIEPADDEEVEVLLELGARLEGQVLSDDGSPIARAVVRVEPASPAGSPSRLTLTDVEGVFTFDNLDSGEMTISARAEGYLESPKVLVELSADIGKGGVELRLTRGNALTGRVSAANGQPIAGARIEARQSQAQATSNDQGRYRLESLEPGEQTVIVRREGFLHRVEKIEILSGVSVFDFVLDSGLNVSGRLVGEDGIPLAGGRVTLTRQGALSGEQRGVGVSRSTSDTSGNFKLGGLSDGAYRLLVEKEGFSTHLWPESLEVRGASVAGLEIVLERGITVTGELLGVEFDDLAYVEVVASSTAGITLDGEVDPTGRYRLAGISPGEWILGAVETSTGRRAIVRTEIRPGESGRVLDLDLRDGHVLLGRVLVDGQPGSGARVLLRAGIPWAGGRATTRHDGSFRIAGIEAGDYQLEVTQPATSLRHIEPLVMVGDERRTIEIATSSLVGRVVEAANAQPLAGVALSLEAAAGPVDGLPPQVVTSDGDGRFSFRRLSVGTYQVVGEKTGYGSARSVVEVQAGTVEETELALEATGGLLLRLARPAGEMPHSVDIALLDATGQAVASGTYPVEARGLVRVATAPEGSWWLVVSAGGAAAAGFPISVSTAPVDVVLEEAAGLELVVPELQGSALVAQIYLTNAQGIPLALPLPGGNLRRQWSLLYGRALISGLPAGSWSIRVVATAGRTWEGTGTAEAGTNSQVTLN